MSIVFYFTRILVIVLWGCWILLSAQISLSSALKINFLRKSDSRESKLPIVVANISRHKYKLRLNAMQVIIIQLLSFLSWMRLRRNCSLITRTRNAFSRLKSEMIFCLYLNHNHKNVPSLQTLTWLRSLSRMWHNSLSVISLLLSIGLHGIVCRPHQTIFSL